MKYAYKNDYCFTNRDLFENLNLKELNLPKHIRKEKKKDTLTEYVTTVFMECFQMILLDIIENNATFVLPLFGNKEACFYVKTYGGENFRKARSAGMFQDIDYLTTGFKAYNIVFQYSSPAGLKEKVLHLSPKIKKLFIDNINSGKQYY